MPGKGKPLDPEVMDQHREGYLEAVTQSMLDDVFGKWDSIHGENGLPYLDRADHIIINGRTATEHLMERFNQKFPELRNKNGDLWRENERRNAYADFRQSVGKHYINLLISGALANGGNVEVFVPDKVTGKIEDTPTRLTATGSELAGPLVKPKALNGWQKFWSKLGFYKKEKAAVVNYEKEVAARKKVQFCNKAARANLASNFSLGPDYLAEMREFCPEVLKDMEQNFPQTGGKPSMLPPSNGFENKRSSFYANMINVLATKRDPKDPTKLLYTNKQLFDMNHKEMCRARAQAAKEVYEHYKTGDTDWLVDLQRDAANVLTERLSDQARNLDFSRQDLTDQEGYREFGLLSNTAFELSQDATNKTVQNRMIAKHGKEAYEHVLDLVSDCTQVHTHVSQSLLAQKTLLQNPFGKLEDQADEVGMEYNTVFMGQASQQYVAREMREHPEKSFAEIANHDFIKGISDVVGQAEIDERLIDQTKRLIEEQGANPEKFNRQITGGVLGERMKLRELSPEGGARFEVRDAATAEREMKRREQKAQERSGPGMEAGG